MRARVLWIEDRANDTWRNLPGPVHNSGRYELVKAVDATDAYKKVFDGEYDVVIADIRIPPGTDERWNKLFTEHGSDKRRARLGLHLLHALLGPEPDPGLPSWIAPERFGILSVETKADILVEIEATRITVFRERNTTVTRYVLLELIEEVLTNRNIDVNRLGDPDVPAN